MAGIKDYSTTAASNTALFPEGMAPSAVNDNMRQVQADIRSWYQDAEWVNWGDSVSRNSATVFKIATDVTARYTVNRRIKLNDASTLYGTIVASSYSAPDTSITVTTDSGSLTASLSSVALSIITPTSVSIPSTIGRKGADIASASTVDLSVASGDFVDITGTTTITAFGTVAAGVERTVRFTGALTLTHNGTSLILPGAANITTAANDTAIFRSLGSGNWLCIDYKKADGTAVVSTTVSAASQADQETGTSTTTYVSPGRQQFHASAAKVWALADSAGTNTTSYNVSSIVDVATGNIGIVFATDFSSTTYSASVTVRVSSGVLRVATIYNEGTVDAGRCDFLCVDGGTTVRDPNFWHIQVFGDQ